MQPLFYVRYINSETDLPWFLVRIREKRFQKPPLRDLEAGPQSLESTRENSYAFYQ